MKEPIDLGPTNRDLLTVITGAREENLMKGKYAKRATNRRAAEEVAVSEEAYRRNIVRLTEERNKARAERDEAIANWKKEVRILQAQLAEGTSPRVEALARESNRLRESLEAARREHGERRKRWEGAGERLMHHFIREHGLAGQEAFSAVLLLLTGEKQIVTVDRERQFHDAFGSDALRALRDARHRGQR